VRWTNGQWEAARVRSSVCRKRPTFQEVGERWTSGAPAKQYPDQIREKRGDDDESRLRMYIYPTIGNMPIDRVTLGACEDVMRSLPSKLAVNTRRNNRTARDADNDPGGLPASTRRA
jgi:hypothetical protein